MPKRHSQKLNKQAIMHIAQKELVWPELGDSPSAIHFYHLIDYLGRKWQTIGCHVTDATKVFGAGERKPWTYIIEPAPYDPALTINELIGKLNIQPNDGELSNDMQIILNTPSRRNQFVARIVNVNHYSIYHLLYALKSEFLLNDLMPQVTFREMYSVNPVEALSLYFLENVDINIFWEWVEVGGTADVAIACKQGNPEMGLTEAIDTVKRSQAISS